MKKKQSNFMNLQKLLLMVFGLLCAIFGTVAPAKAQINQTILDQIKTMTFQHQGMTSKMSDLNFIKQQINNGVEPWASNYHKLATSNSIYTSLTYTPNAMDYPTNTNGGENREMIDAVAAKTQALMWIFTGNTAYAENVRNILNAWETTLVDQQGLNWMLDAAWAAYMFADAAELVRNSYSGWTITDTENFTKMTNDVWLPILNRRIGFGNRELAVSTALCAIGVFNNDRAAFYKGVLYWMDYIPSYIYMTADGAAPIVADYWTHELTNDEYAAMDADISGTSGTNWWTYSNMLKSNSTRFLGLQTTPSGSQSGQNGNWVASKFTADANMPVNTMAIYQKNGNGGHARLGIYSDNSGTPGTLLAQTSLITFTSYNGVYSKALNKIVYLTSGSSYWEVYEVDSPSTTLSYSDTGTTCFASSAFGGLPTSAPAGLTTGTTGVYNIYANNGAPFSDDRTDMLNKYNAGKPAWYGVSGTEGVWIQGTCAETFRDLAHVENSISHIFNTAEIAWNQGIDLYSICPDRLAAFVDMNAYLRLGNPCPGGYAVNGSGYGLMATYEIAYNHLANIMQMSSSLPYTRQLIYPTIRKCSSTTIAPAPAGILASRLGGQFGWYTVCETLTHGELNNGGDVFNLKCVSSGTPSSTDTYQVVNSELSVTSNASLWIKGTGQVSLQIKSDSLGTLLASIDINATSTWTKYTTADFISGASGKLSFELVDLGTTAGTVYIDNCFMGPTEIDAANLLANPSFESGLSPWTSTSSTVWTLLDEVPTLDTTLPVVLTQNITIQLDTLGQASITEAQIDNGSSDASGIASMVVSKTAFDCSNVGTNTVVLTVTDVNGNSSTANAVVTVQDSTVPVAIAQNITIELDATGAASIVADQINNGSTDVCGIASLAVSQTAFNCSNVGANTVTLTVTDVNGNSSTADAVVTVQDSIVPVAIAQNITIELDATGAASIAANQINNGSTDVCGIASLAVSQTAFNCSNVGANTVTLTVTDVNGNSSMADAVVTVQDNIAPVAITQNITIELDATGAASIAANQINNASTDVCGIASLAVSPTAFNCSNVGANTVTLTVTDVNGNSSTADAVVTVQDNIAPVAITQNISVTLQNGSAIITASSIDNGSYDACDIQSIVIDQSEFDCSNIGNNIVTLSVTDKNGNVSSTTAIITVIGDQPVASIAVGRTDNTFTGLDSKTIALGYGAQMLTLTASNSTSGNNITSYIWSPSTGLDNATIADPVFSPTLAGAYTFMVTATNEFGCSASTSVNITVIDVRCGNKNNKVLVQHKTGSSSNQWNQICISTNAVDTHLKHGDKLGSCASSETDTSNTTKSASINQEAVSKNISITTQEATLTVYPNPFSSTTNFEFRIANSGFVNLKVFDIFGREVATLVNEVKSPGTFTVQWNAENSGSGTYLVRMITGEQTKRLKVLLEK